MSLSSYIDHTLLRTDATKDEITLLCKEADEYQFASVCVPPNFVPLAYEKLKDSDVKVCTVIGFPLGYSTTETKVFETDNAIRNGADEIDMVIAINKAKSKNWQYVQEDIYSVFEICHQYNKTLKVIVETCLLTEEEKKIIYDICTEIGVDFVKTSTGFSKAGATIEDVKLMKACISDHMQVKASGGIRDKKFATALLNAGATRLGCSSSLNLIKS